MSGGNTPHCCVFCGNERKQRKRTFVSWWSSGPKQGKCTACSTCITYRHLVPGLLSPQSSSRYWDKESWASRKGRFWNFGLNFTVTEIQFSGMVFTKRVFAEERYLNNCCGILDTSLQGGNVGEGPIPSYCHPDLVKAMQLPVSSPFLRCYRKRQ